MEMSEGGRDGAAVLSECRLYSASSQAKGAVVGTVGEVFHSLVWGGTAVQMQGVWEGV